MSLQKTIGCVENQYFQTDSAKMTSQSGCGIHSIMHKAPNLKWNFKYSAAISLRTAEARKFVGKRINNK